MFDCFGLFLEQAVLGCNGSSELYRTAVDGVEYPFDYDPLPVYPYQINVGNLSCVRPHGHCAASGRGGGGADSRVHTSSNPRSSVLDFSPILVDFSPILVDLLQF